MCTKDNCFDQGEVCDRDVAVPAGKLTDEDRERIRYEKKADLLRRALLEADEMDNKQNLSPTAVSATARCAPVDPIKLAEAGIVTRDHLKGRFFRVDIDWGSSGIWETDEPCAVGGMGYNLDYDEFELPEWLLNRFHFWEHWHGEADAEADLPIDIDWESFQAYGRSLAVDLKYHLGPEVSVCYREKEITLGPLFREPMPKVWPYPELLWKRDGLTMPDE